MIEDALRDAARDDRLILAAWGANAAKAPERVEWLRGLPGADRLRALSITKGGHPGHPADAAVRLPADSMEGGVVTKPCPKSAVWPEVPPHGIRLRCIYEAGHTGDCAADTERMEYLPAPTEETA